MTSPRASFFVSRGEPSHRITNRAMHSGSITGLLHLNRKLGLCSGSWEPRSTGLISELLQTALLSGADLLERVSHLDQCPLCKREPYQSGKSAKSEADPDLMG